MPAIITSPSVTDLRTERIRRIERLRFDYAKQPKEGRTACNLCDAKAWHLVSDVDRYGYPVSAVACEQCGLTVRNPRMTSAAYGEFYRCTYRPLVSAYHGRLIDAQTIQLEQHEYSRHLVDVLKPYLTRCGYRTLLDVGGSTGIVSSHLSQAFELEATVIDPAPAEVEVARRLGIRTVVGFVEGWEPDRKYDVVGMFQTVDHLLDARGTLEKLRAILSPGGRFIVDIVDFRRAYLRHRRVAEGIKIDHVYSFTELTFEPLLLRVGFCPLVKSPSSDGLHVLYICEASVPKPLALPSAAELAGYFAELAELTPASPGTTS